MAIQVVVDPSTFKSRVLGIPNDGLDYDILLLAGKYDFSIPPFDGSETLNHTAGGKLTFRNHTQDGGAIFGPGSNTVTTFSDLNIWANEIEWDGLTLRGDPYYVEAPFGPVYRIFNLNLGGRDDLGHPPCTSVKLTNVSIEGATSAVIIWPSISPTERADIQIRHVRCHDNNGNGQIVVIGGMTVADGVGANADILYDDIIADNTNGPDGTFWGGIPGSSHGNGTALIGCLRLAHASTLTISNAHLTSRIRGSWNHDSHCFQFSQLQSSDVRVVLRDVKMFGRWEEGHSTHDGGGNHWLGYYHGGGPEYLTPGTRPRIDYYNCTFSNYISPSVPQRPGDDPFGDPALYAFGVFSSSDQHFWDCEFIWDLPSYWYIPSLHYIGAVGSYFSVNCHSCTFTGPSLDDTPSGVGTTRSDDSQTLGWSGVHRRPNHRT